MNPLKAWLRGFVPAPLILGWRERLVACIGAGLGLLGTEAISRLALGDAAPWFLVPMGASAVLLFAVPASPLAQPWSIVGGNLVAALLGVACAQLIGDREVAAAVAGSLAIAVMFSLRCLHPPAGAVALTAVLGGPEVRALGFGFALAPVLLNSLLLLALALVFNNLLRHRYPHAAAPAGNAHGTSDPPPAQRLGFTRADLDEAIRAHDELLDVSEDDLEDILRRVELRAFERHRGALTCADIMSTDIVTARAQDSALHAWDQLERHALHSLPVVDAAGALAGIVTLRDLVRALQHDAGATVASLMTHKVHTASAHHSLAELAPLFMEDGFHHLPVLDGARRVVGMVTQSDLVAALVRDNLVQAAKRPARLAHPV